MELATHVNEINQKVRNESRFVEQLVGEVHRVIVGQKYMIERLLIGLFTRGHILLEGVPGLAKTLAVKTLSSAIETKFQRIQFTPDLLPADLIGTMIYSQKDGAFFPKKGPLFANLILADEINRGTGEGAECLAGGDAGKADHNRGSHLSFGRAIPGAGHSESYRAGRNLSPA